MRCPRAVAKPCVECLAAVIVVAAALGFRCRRLSCCRGREAAAARDAGDAGAGDEAVARLAAFLDLPASPRTHPASSKLAAPSLLDTPKAALRRQLKKRRREDTSHWDEVVSFDGRRRAARPAETPEDAAARLTVEAVELKRAGKYAAALAKLYEAKREAKPDGPVVEAKAPEACDVWSFQEKAVAPPPARAVESSASESDDDGADAPSSLARPAAAARGDDDDDDVAPTYRSPSSAQRRVDRAPEPTSDDDEDAVARLKAEAVELKRAGKYAAALAKLYEAKDDELATRDDGPTVEEKAPDDAWSYQEKPAPPPAAAVESSDSDGDGDDDGVDTPVSLARPAAAARAPPSDDDESDGESEARSAPSDDDDHLEASLSVFGLAPGAAPRHDDREAIDTPRSLERPPAHFPAPTPPRPPAPTTPRSGGRPRVSTVLSDAEDPDEGHDVVDCPLILSRPHAGEDHEPIDHDLDLDFHEDQATRGLLGANLAASFAEVVG